MDPIFLDERHTLISLENRTLSNWPTVRSYFFFGSVETFPPLAQAQKWLDLSDLTVLAHLPNASECGGYYSCSSYLFPLFLDVCQVLEFCPSENPLKPILVSFAGATFCLFIRLLLICLIRSLCEQQASLAINFYCVPKLWRVSMTVLWLWRYFQFSRRFNVETLFKNIHAPQHLGRFLHSIKILFLWAVPQFM